MSFFIGLKNMELTEKEIKEIINTKDYYKVYKTGRWYRLKAKVLKEFHNECYLCKQQGKITMADTVHHVKEVKKYPSLVYEEFYYDNNGERKRNLIPLCNGCHNKVHKRFGHPERKKPLNEERW